MNSSVFVSSQVGATEGVGFYVSEQDEQLSNSFGRPYPPPRLTETFIVRLWAEYLEQATPARRGEIKHVGSKEVMRFGEVGKMLEIIEGLTMRPKNKEQGGCMDNDSASEPIAD